MRVAVVGAGVIGVGSALAVLETVPGVEVTIISERVTPNTTGNGAAGLWGPHLVKGDPNKIELWSRGTHDLLEKLWREGGCEGIGLFSGVETMHPERQQWESVPFYCAPPKRPMKKPPLSSTSVSVANPTDLVAPRSDNPASGRNKEGTKKTKSSTFDVPEDTGSSFSDICEDEAYSASTEEEKTESSTPNSMPSGRTRQCQIVTFYAEPTKLLPYLMERFQSLGGSIVIRKVTSLSELEPDYDLVVNCSGLGAYHLVEDHSMQPIRGQVLRVRASFIKSFMSEGDSYIVPNDDVIILGGTAQAGDWRQQPDAADSARILDGCCRLVPSLKTTRLEQAAAWAGLRPFRPGGVRLELEECLLNGRKVPIVHNYGHGGGGVTLFWGCALEVADIVRGRVRMPRTTSKL